MVLSSVCTTASALTWPQASPALQRHLREHGLDENSLIMHYDLLGEEAPGPEQALGELPAPGDLGPEQALGEQHRLPEHGPEQALGGRDTASERTSRGRPTWLPYFLQARQLWNGLTLEELESHWEVVWCRITEALTGNLVIDSPCTAKTLPPQAYESNFMTEVWGAPRKFLSKITIATPDSPIVGFDYEGRLSDTGPLWAFEGPLAEDEATDFLEVGNAGNHTDFPQDPGSLFWEASFGKHTWKPLKHGFLDLAKN